MNLYELTGQLMELQSMLEDESIDSDVLADTLEGVEGEFDLKMENYCKVVKNLEGKSKMIKTEIDRLKSKKQSIEDNIDRMKKFMYDSMKIVGKTESGGDLFTAKIQKNGGMLPVILDSDELPENLVKIKIEPDMDAIRNALDNGDCKYAHYGERGERLKIK